MLFQARKWIEKQAMSGFPQNAEKSFFIFCLKIFSGYDQTMWSAGLSNLQCLLVAAK
jgi:hypothetical protein